MTPQEIKESLLWNAIQGKITSQQKNETVSDVIGQLQLSDISEEEVYFDIPNNWRWVKIGEIFELVNGKAFKPSDWSEQGIPIVRIQNLNDPNAPYNYFSGEIEEKYILRGEELLFSWSGTPGTSFGAFIWHGGLAALNQHIFIVYPRINIDYEYAKLALNGELRIFISKAHGGAGLKHITKKEFESCYLPIPPLAEQKRIVAKIEELLPMIDRYEKAWTHLEEFNKRFPGDIQKSILQMAIQGKLVEQRPEEGSGEELYQQIQAEKQNLIKAGKIKKEKPLPDITEDEIPFDIPESWKWCRLYDLCSLIGDIDHNMPKAVEPENGVLFLSAKDLLDDGTINYTDNVKYISEEDFIRLSRKALPQKNDIIYSRIGAALGKARVVTSETRFLVSYSCCTIRTLLVEPMYLRYYLESPFILKHSFDARQSTGVPDLGMGEIKKYIIALPPLLEQKRIVSKLEEVLPLCERLK